MKQLENFDGERSTKTKKDDFADAIASAYNFLSKERVIRVYSLPDTTSPTAYTSYRKSIR
jgi:hypothetical protein